MFQKTDKVTLPQSLRKDCNMHCGSYDQLIWHTTIGVWLCNTCGGGYSDAYIQKHGILANSTNSTSAKPVSPPAQVKTTLSCGWCGQKDVLVEEYVNTQGAPCWVQIDSPGCRAEFTCDAVLRDTGVIHSKWSPSFGQTAKHIHKTLNESWEVRVGDVADYGTACTCDMTGPNMMLGCRCDAGKAELEAERKSKASVREEILSKYRWGS